MFKSKKIATITSLVALVSMLSVSAFAADKAQEQQMEPLQIAMKVIPATEIGIEAPEAQNEVTQIKMTKILLPEQVDIEQESIPAIALTPAMTVE